MSFLFNGCRKLIKIEAKNIKDWNVRNVEDMSYMFSRCIKLKEIHGINNWKTNNLKNVCGMFNRCEGGLSILFSHTTGYNFTTSIS